MYFPLGLFCSFQFSVLFVWETILITFCWANIVDKFTISGRDICHNEKILGLLVETISSVPHG